ncbi:MAG: hypothetical protein WBD40_13030 [Tepidisphaeraceae bacterium]
MSERHLPNPFECARRVGGVNVQLKPEDVMNVWGMISGAEAERLLDEHGTEIAAQMLAAGIDAAVTIMRAKGGST